VRFRIGVVFDSLSQEENMSINIPIEPLIGFLIIGLVAGFLAEQIIRGRGAGLVINLAVGVVGAFIGGFLFGFLKLSFHGLIGSLISATLGAVVLLFLLGLVKIMLLPQKSEWQGWKNWARALGRHQRGSS
jgi:uncharacterized membrane protein YeaQ/YmgE (transglycosylase-associated protein family)